MRESSRGRWSGRLPVDAGGREAGYSQLARAPYASMAYRCVFRGGFVPNNGGIGENGAEPSRRMAGEADFLKRS